MSDNFSNYDAQVWEFLLFTDEFEWEETTTNELPDFSIIENGNSSKIKPSDERFRDVKFDYIDNFLKENENENTRKKTGEKTEIENLSAESLNETFSTFLLSVRKKDGSEYEPTTLRGFLCILNRYLRQKNSNLNVNSRPQFAKCREVLKAKQKQLKGLEYGNKPNASDEITDEDINKLFDCSLLGVHSPLALVNFLHLTFAMSLGMRGGKEQRDLKFGDIVIDKDASGEEFIQHVKELQTKTRTGADQNNSKEIKTTAWANDNPNRCPVNAFRMFTSKRPAKMMKLDSPFFLSVNHVSDRQLHHAWFKVTAMGVNHLYGLTKNMIKSCPSFQDGRKLTNHSARRHLVQKLQDRGVQNTQIMQISGHTNFQSVNTYSRLKQNQQKSISKVLSDTKNKVVFDKGKPSENTNSNNSVRSIAPCEMNPNLSQLSSTASTSSMTYDTKMSSLFYGNTYIYRGTFNFNNPQSSQKRQSDDSGLQIAKSKYKRILPLSFSYSDSE